MRKKFSHFTAEFKLSVLQRMRQEDLSASQVIALFDIRGGTGVIRTWQSQYHAGDPQALESKPRGRPKKMPAPESPKLVPPHSENERTLEQLRKENEYLRAENAYLKKIESLASGQRAGRAEKARVVLELRQGYPLAILLKAADLSRSTFYYQVKAQEPDDQHADLKSRIRGLYEEHKGRYGYRRITAALRQAGELINHKAVQRLMRMLGLKSLVRPKKYRS